MVNGLLRRRVREPFRALALVLSIGVGSPLFGQDPNAPPGGNPAPANPPGNGGGVLGVPFPQGGTLGTPTPAYFGMIEGDYLSGNYPRALKEFQSEYRRGIKFGANNNWIDSICYLTMQGECYYQMGQHRQALAAYTNALQLFTKYSDWLLRVQFTQPIRPANPGQIVRVPWGVTTRNLVIGHYPTDTPIRLGQVNAAAALVQGGPVMPPVNYNINVQEIVRCTALAIRRRHELLGPLSPYDSMNKNLVTVLAQRPGPPNHWSECFIDTQLGLVYAAVGKPEQAAVHLNRAIVAGGQFDHPLTPTVLLELGKLSLQAGSFGEAGARFLEASYSAANYHDIGVLEESFRLGLTAHLLSGQGGVLPQFALGATWARRDYPQMYASLNILAAENCCAVGNPQNAMTFLNFASAATLRHPMGLGKVGARLKYVQALANFQQGNVAAGETALSAALGLMNNRNAISLWNFQIALTDEFAVNAGPQGQLTVRDALSLFEVVLRDPATADWAIDPLETLSMLSVPHGGAFEHWFELECTRGAAFDKALEVSDLAKRHRFLSTTELGGRLMGLRWALEAPEELLNEKALLERQAILARYPAYDQLAKQAQAIRASLAAKPLTPPDKEIAKAQVEELKQLTAISLGQETILRELALSRVPSAVLFPPRRSKREIQRGLPDGVALLDFFSTSRGLWGFLMSNQDTQYKLWNVGSAPVLQKQSVNLLKQIGNFAENKGLTLDELTNEDWKEPARLILEKLTVDNDMLELTKNFEELVIVPDGALWYLPFEALQLGRVDEGAVPLGSKVRVRYAPLASLAIGDPRPRKTIANTAVMMGRYKVHGTSKEKDEINEAAFEELARVTPGSSAIRAPLPGVSASYSTLFDRMIVLGDVDPPESQGYYNWAPAQLDRGVPGSALAQWMALPWGGPEQILLPGFHSAAENGLKKQSAATAGNDLFLSILGLMSTGSRTILISRWRTAGQTSENLIREFTQELVGMSPVKAWQRAVLLCRESPLDPASEPRIKTVSSGQPTAPPNAEHPLFWAGYLLVDGGDYVSRNDPPGADIAPKPLAEARPKGEAAEGDRAAIDNDAIDKGPPGKKPKKEKPRAKPADAPAGADPVMDAPPKAKPKRPKEVKKAA